MRRTPSSSSRRSPCWRKRRSSSARRLPRRRPRLIQKLAGKSCRSFRSSPRRKQQEEELELQNSLRKEREKLESAENRYQRANTRLREIRSSAADGSSAALLSQLMEETSSNRCGEVASASHPTGLSRTGNYDREGGVVRVAFWVLTFRVLQLRVNEWKLASWRSAQ